MPTIVRLHLLSEVEVTKGKRQTVIDAERDHVTFQRDGHWIRIRLPDGRSTLLYGGAVRWADEKEEEPIRKG